MGGHHAIETRAERARSRERRLLEALDLIVRNVGSRGEFRSRSAKHQPELLRLSDASGCPMPSVSRQTLHAMCRRGWIQSCGSLEGEQHWMLLAGVVRAPQLLGWFNMKEHNERH